MRDTLQFDHSQDTPVYIVDWDRLEVQWAATVNGTKATTAAYPLNITPDIPEMVNVDRSATAGYFFTRYNNTNNSDNSDFSDAIPYGGYDDNTVFMIKKRALDEVGEEVDGKIITHEFLNQALWEGRREYHQAPGKRPFRRKFNTDIGNALTGSFRIELPTDVERPHTAENIYGVRIGTEANMTYYDKKQWDFDWRNIPRTTLTTAHDADTDKFLYVANARDFANSGVVYIEGTTVGYTAKSNTGGTMTVDTDNRGDWDASAGSDVYQNVADGLPDKFTVWADPDGSAYVYFNRPISTTYIGQNIWSDYYSRLLGRDSDADVLDEPKYDKFVYFLKAKIKERKSRGALDITTDSDYKQWIFHKNEALNSEVLLTDIRIEPEVSHLPIP